MARKPRKERAGSKQRGKKSASGRRIAPKRSQKRARKSSIKVAKKAKGNRRAIGNAASLKRELKEAHARQAATAEILSIVASSPDDVKPVFEAIVKSAVELCEARFGAVFKMEGDLLHVVADHNFGPIQRQLLRAMYPMVPNRGHISGRAILDGAVVQIPDIYADEHYRSVEAKKAGFRSLLAAPLLHGSKAIGSIVIFRTERGTFKESQSTLLQSFAAQAVIAIENTRLFNETKEALAQQTASSEVLEVISSTPGDLQPVFKSMLNNALRICEAKFGQLLLFDGKGFLAAELHNTPVEYAELFRHGPLVPGPNTGLGRLIASKKFIHIHDVMSGSLYAEREPLRVATVEIMKARTLLAVPMLKDTKLVGAIIIYRQEARPFSDRQITLVTNFAAQAVIAVENARLFNETKEALERQTATANILKVIAGSPTDVQPVFDAIAESAKRLLTSHTAVVTRVIDGVVHLAASTAESEAPAHAAQGLLPYPLSSDRIHARVARTGQIAVNTDAPSSDLPQEIKEFARTVGWRSMLVVPMLRNKIAIGTIGITRREAGSFDDTTIDLLKTFADQAVIAIENARLFNETKEALERQTATSDILKVIASSPDDVQPVFDAIAESARRVIGGHSALVTRLVGEEIQLAAFTTGSEAGRERLLSTYPQPLSSQVLSAQALRSGQVAFYADTERDADDITRGFGRARGYRSVISVPMLRDGLSIGTVNVTRAEPGAFDENTVGLLKTFADQAVIAIENARLFNETREALAQQTATSEVLSVISNSVADTAPVFERILDSCEKLFATEQLGIFVVRPDGQTHVGAWRGSAVEGVIQTLPRQIEETATGLVIRNRAVLNIPNTATAQEMPSTIQSMRDAIGDVSIAWAPMLTEEGGIGSISVMRQPPNPFSEKELALLKTFADQAVIAIQNTRLFNETREALERQTATADILRVIAGSPDDVRPVFQAIADRSNRLVEALSTTAFRLVDGMLHLQAFTPTTPEADATLQAAFPAPLSAFSWGDSIGKGEIFRVIDAEQEPERLRDLARERGWRSALLVPLLRDGKAIGMIGPTRAEPGPFSDHHVQLMQTFADQAVIAIENARLFNETKEALARQTATADVLKVIASSPSNLQPVFDAIAERSNELMRGHSTTVFRFVGDVVELAALTSVSQQADAVLRAAFPRPLAAAVGFDAILRGEVMETIDATSDTEAETSRAIARARGFRSRLVVPLKSDSGIIGAISITRQEPGGFVDKDKDLLQTFADQAVIAIQNVELFEEVQARTRELSQSLEDLRTAQDRLVQTEKLASLGQLTAGIAHEIKNPLNFVNNFSALSVELTDELNDVLRQAQLAEKLRQEVNELTQLLKSNLEKVVQHGKRADSIVKNMLLHSREGAGEQRAADINALVEESLNLAYHGARAEKSGFNITLQREFDAAAGSAELFPQEITRALLNLISNGFYAATRRKAEYGEATFEPTLLAATRDLGSSVQIRIRDNGTGIPPDVKEKMFNPFFTTKPAGEGTGLGLSMTHDIIVKQHGGSIDVATEPGNFTEFIVVLPRANNSHNRSKG